MPRLQLQEACVLWKLRHANLLGLSGIFISGGQGILLMELCEGGSLDRMMEADNAEGKQRAFSWYNR